MPYPSDLFVSVKDEALNRVSRHILRQNPALFNFGTQLVVDNPSLLCFPVSGDPPLVTRVAPFAIPSSNGGDTRINYCYQFADFKVDFYPSAASMPLPPQLGNQLPPQTFAAYARTFAGVELAPGQAFTCVSFELYVVFNLRTRQTSSGTHEIYASLERINGQDAIELVDIQPVGLESIVEGLLKIVLVNNVISELKFDVSSLAFKIGDLAELGLVPHPAANCPDGHNPSIVDSELQLFLDAVVS